MSKIIDVSTLNRFAKAALSASGKMQDLVVCGEVTNFTRHYKSGHCYFTLRDAGGSVKAVLFSRQARLLEFTPEDGMLVLAYGNATIYERDGSFQLYVEYLRPYGVGAAQRAFDQLKARLEKEGLFLPEHKKPLPAHPACIGLVTSKTGAALQDILQVSGRRWPMAHFVLAPVSVQGLEAEEQVVAGIKALDKSKKADVIIVARGGGGREDLWVFNSEKIARAAYACKTPLVSAVGHEIDYTILDYVADMRAPTPSAAAELCVPDVAEQMQKIFIFAENIHNNIQSRMNLCYNALDGLSARLETASAMGQVQARQAQLTQLQTQVQAAVQQSAARSTRQLGHCAALAQSLNPYGVLARGYAMVQDADGRILLPDTLEKNDRFTLIGTDRLADCQVLAVRNNNEATQDESTQNL